MKEKIEFQIDDVPERSSSHPVMKTFMVLAILGVLAVAVWFFGFSEWGILWSGNTARQRVESPEDVVTSYPKVVLSLDEVALMHEPGESTVLKVKIQKSANASDLNIKDLKLAWTSQNPHVASVDSKGRVTAVGMGSATIGVSVANSDVDANPAFCLVTVRNWGDDVEQQQSPDFVDPLDYDDGYKSHEPKAPENRITTPEVTTPKQGLKQETTPVQRQEKGAETRKKESSDIDVSSLKGKTSVFGGLGEYDKANRTIVMKGTKAFIVYDTARKVITLHAGDRITDVVVSKDGYLTQGTFHYQGSKISDKDLRIQL